MSYQDFIARKAEEEAQRRRDALLKKKGRKRVCPCCGWGVCHCQLSLEDWKN